MTIRGVGVTAVAAFLLLSLSALPAAAQDEFSVFPPDLFPDPERPLSRFPHEEHMVYDDIEDCYVCHHVYRGGELLEGETSDGVPCGECHKLDADDGVDRLRAYHQRCKGCHEKIKKGPITCGECHVRD